MKMTMTHLQFVNMAKRKKKPRIYCATFSMRPNWVFLVSNICWILLTCFRPKQGKRLKEKKEEGNIGLPIQTALKFLCFMPGPKINKFCFPTDHANNVPTITHLIKDYYVKSNLFLFQKGYTFFP